MKENVKYNLIGPSGHFVGHFFNNSFFCNGRPEGFSGCEGYVLNDQFFYGIENGQPKLSGVIAGNTISRIPDSCIYQIVEESF
jgi:hypothetical protein